MAKVKDQTPDSLMEIGDIKSVFGEDYAGFAVSSCARSIPDVRDGLKPVHRRILHVAADVAPATRSTLKSASIVGTTLSVAHPHGDMSVYDALTRMTLSYAQTIPLIEGQGNMGTIDGMKSSAPRYTEARLSKAAAWLVMEGSVDGAVRMIPNYDGRHMLPELLPVRLPMMLLNGVPTGTIAVGYTSQVPPHNAAELARVCKLMIHHFIHKTPVPMDEVMRLMPGPDYPTGGILSDPASIRQIYETGQGAMSLRGTMTIKPGSGRSGAEINITSIPFGLTTSAVVESITIAMLGKKDPKTGVRDTPTIPEIKKVNDQTVLGKDDEPVVSIAIELKANADPQVVCNQLLQYTNLMGNTSVYMYASDANKRPVMYNLESLIREWFEFRRSCIRSLKGRELESTHARIHIVQGLKIAIAAIEDVVNIIKSSKTEADAIDKLRTKYKITTAQANAICSMPLRRIIGLSVTELNAEEQALTQKISDCTNVILNDSAIIGIINSELDYVIATFNRPRRTTIESSAVTSDTIAVTPLEDCIISMTTNGYIKRIPADHFRIQKRATQGNANKTKVRDKDQLDKLVPCTSHDIAYAVTDGGTVVRLDVHDIPTSTSGRHATNLGFEEKERVKGLFVSPRENFEDLDIIVATTEGVVKRTALSEIQQSSAKRLVFFQNETKSSEIAGCSLIKENSGQTIFMATASGLGARFSPEEVRRSQRVSGGVSGMNVSSDDKLIAMEVVSSEEDVILCVTEQGTGKCVSVSEFSVKGRGVLGMILTRLQEGDSLVKALVASKGMSVLIATARGKAVRISMDEIGEPLKRPAFGKRLITLDEGDKVVSAAIIPNENTSAPLITTTATIQ